jgi:hypothetical protein
MTILLFIIHFLAAKGIVQELVFTMTNSFQVTSVRYNVGRDHCRKCGLKSNCSFSVVEFRVIVAIYQNSSDITHVITTTDKTMIRIESMRRGCRAARGVWS